MVSRSSSLTMAPEDYIEDPLDEIALFLHDVVTTDAPP